MKMMLRIAWLGLIGLAAVASAVPAHAEVAVRTDLDGQYRSFLAVTEGSTGAVWGVHRRSRVNVRLSEPLNPNGAAFGDLAPRIVETTQRPNHPWVIWSRPEAGEFDLVWSRWTNDGWAEILPVGLTAIAGDDLDPDLLFDASGTGFLAWTNESGDDSTIMIRQATEIGWTEPFQVSPHGLNGSNPRLQWGPLGSLVVEYQTDAGTVRQYLMLRDPDTITDDINPAHQFVLKGQPHAVSSSDNRKSALPAESNDRNTKGGSQR